MTVAVFVSARLIRIRTIRFLACLIIVVAMMATIGCARDQVEPERSSDVETPSKSPDEDSIPHIITTLEKCPAWTNMEIEDTAEKESLLECLDELSTYETSILRKAIEQFISEERRREKDSSIDVVDVFNDLSKLFVLNRYIFDVPAKSSRQDSRSFGGFWGVPGDDKEVNRLWPLGTTPDGELDLVGECQGYTGPPFRALAEFDYFNERFGRRASTQEEK